MTFSDDIIIKMKQFANIYFTQTVDEYINRYLEKFYIHFHKQKEKDREKGENLLNP